MILIFVLTSFLTLHQQARKVTLLLFNDEELECIRFAMAKPEAVLWVDRVDDVERGGQTL